MPDKFRDERPILDDADREILDEYERAEEISDRTDLARYVRALAKLTLAIGRQDSFHMGDVQRMVGVANDLEDGEYDVDEIQKWLDGLSFKDGVEAP